MFQCSVHAQMICSTKEEKNGPYSLLIQQTPKYHGWLSGKNIYHRFSNYDKNVQQFWHISWGFYQLESTFFLAWHFVKTKSSLNKPEVDKVLSYIHQHLHLPLILVQPTLTAVTQCPSPRRCSHPPRGLGTVSMTTDVKLFFSLQALSYLVCFWLSVQE